MTKLMGRGILLISRGQISQKNTVEKKVTDNPAEQGNCRQTCSPNISAGHSNSRMLSDLATPGEVTCGGSQVSTCELAGGSQPKL